MINTIMITKMIDTFILPEVQEELNSIQPTLNGRQPYNTNIVEWLSPVIDLSDFFVYPVNGVTEAINWWQNKEKRNIQKVIGDYEWVDTGIHSLYKDNYLAHSTPEWGPVHYVSCPSSIDGNYTDIPTDVPVVLDIAYVGSAPIKKIPMTPNIEKVFFSLSKSFGIGNIRTGWYFTKRPDVKLHALHNEAMYYNYCATQYAEHLINTYSINYVHSKLKDIQTKVCSNYNITPSDCIWLATSTDDKYIDYQRSNNIARLCITKLLKEKHDKQTKKH